MVNGARRGKSSKIFRPKKPLKKCRTPISHDDDSDFNVNTNVASDNKEAAPKRRLRGRTASGSVEKPADKSKRLTRMNIPASDIFELEGNVEEVHYWERRRPLNPNVAYTKPTAKQAADAAADWAEGQRDLDFPEFDLYDVVIQDPMVADVISELNEEPHRRMGDLQFLLRTRYEDPIDEARECHEALFVFKHDMPNDKERQYPRSAALKDGQIRVARVWALSEVKNRKSAQEKCRADEGKLLTLVLEQVRKTDSWLTQWKEEMERRQLRPCTVPEVASMEHSGPAHRPSLPGTDAASESARIEESPPVITPTAQKRPTPVEHGATENFMQPPANKASVTPASSTNPFPLDARFPTPKPRKASVLPMPAMKKHTVSTFPTLPISARSKSSILPPPTLAAPGLGLFSAPTSTPNNTTRVGIGTMPISSQFSSGPRQQKFATHIPTEAEIIRITTEYSTDIQKELRAHIVKNVEYVGTRLQSAIRQFVSVRNPTSNAYSEKQWQQLINHHLTLQQQRFERKWQELHPENSFRPVTQNAHVRQWSIFVADFAMRYPSTEGMSEAEAQEHNETLQRMAMQKQQALLAGWTRYWEVIMPSGGGTRQQANDVPLFAPPTPAYSSVSPSPSLIGRGYDRLMVPDMLNRKRKRIDDPGLDISDPMGPMKVRLIDPSDAMIDPRLRAMPPPGPPQPVTSSRSSVPSMSRSPSGRAIVLNFIKQEPPCSGSAGFESGRRVAVPEHAGSNGLSDARIDPRLMSNNTPVCNVTPEGHLARTQPGQDNLTQQQSLPKLGTFEVLRPFNDVFKNWPNRRESGLRQEHHPVKGV